MARFSFLLLAIYISACKGSEDELVLGYYPSSESERIIEDLKPLEEYLERKLGLEVKPFIATDYTAMVEGLCSGKIDASFLSPFPYTIARRKCNAKMLIMSLREDGSMFYKTYFVINAKDTSNIRSIHDLQGKVWGFPDITSTSGYLFAVLKFKQEGIDVDKAFPKRIQLATHENVLIALYNGEIDFGTIYSDARKLLLEEYPDIMQRIVVIDSMGPIPNDGLAVSPHLDDDLTMKLKQAMLELPKDTSTFNRLVKYGWFGIVPAIDTLYDLVELAAKASGIWKD